MKLKKVIFLALTCLFLGGGSFLSIQILSNANQFTKLKTEYTNARSLNKRLLNDHKWYNLLNPLEDPYLKFTALPKYNKAVKQYKKAENNSIILFIVSILYIGILIVLFMKEPDKHLYIGTGLILLCFLFLINGVFSPMMELGVKLENVGQDVTFKSFFSKVGSLFGTSKLDDIDSVIGFKSIFFGLKGDTYVFFQMKSIFSVIKLLFKEGNIVVGTVILLFSVVTPLMKLSFSILCLYTKAHKSKAINFVIHKLSKWSMLDVFVVALFMAFLSFKNMDTSGAEVITNILMGGYYFLGFVLISIISSYIIDASVKYKIKKENHQ